MIYTKYFIVAFILSAVGSMPIGLITLTIAQRTLEKGSKAGVGVALGATFPEFFYTFSALISLDYLTLESAIEAKIKVASIFLFFALGLYYWFKKTTSSHIQEPKSNRDFFIGFMTASMNVLIVPFWVFIAIWLQSYGFAFDDNTCILVFSLGSALGALLIFYAYVILAESVLKKSDYINFYANKIIGGLFLALAVLQIIQIL